MSAPRWAIEGRDWPNRGASQFVDAGGLRWHVQMMGSGPVALLLHGTGAATHSWRDLAPLLAEHFTIVAPDLPGHGFTTGRPRGGLTLPAMAKAVGALLASLDLTPALLVGHSAGAAIAIRLALDHPHPSAASPLPPSPIGRGKRRAASQGEGEQRTAIVGLNPALTPFPGLGARLFPTLAKLLFANPFAPHVFARIARQPGEAGRFLARTTGSRIDAAGVSQYQRLFACSSHCAGAIGMMAAWDLDALKRDLPKLAAPLLLLHGEADSAIPAASVRSAAALVPGAMVELLPNLGHLAHEEEPAMIAERIAAFASSTGIV